MPAESQDGILLTGATGTVGRTLAGMMSTASIPFKAFVRDPVRAREILGAHAQAAELVRGDLVDPTSLEAALDGTQTLFLLNGNPDLELATVEAAARAGVRRIVKQSALAAGLEPPAFHRRVEEALERSDLGWTHLRPTAFMQTLFAYLPQLVESDGAFRLPAGDGRIAWVDARDIAAVAFRALTESGHEGRIYPITGPESLSMAEVAREISAASGRSVRYEDLAPEKARKRMVDRGLPTQMASFLVGFYSLMREGSTDFATSTVVEVTGEPARDISTFAQQHSSVFSGREAELDAGV